MSLENSGGMNGSNENPESHTRLLVEASWLPRTLTLYVLCVGPRGERSTLCVLLLSLLRAGVRPRAQGHGADKQQNELYQNVAEGFQ